MNNLLKQKEEELKLLMNEKEDLEKTVAEVPELRLQLRQKESEMEMQLTSQKAEIENLEAEVQELKKKLRGKNEEIVNLSLEKEEMMSSLEELDNQHQVAMSHIIQIKDQLTKSNDELKKKVSFLVDDKQSMQLELDKLKSQHMVNQTAESSSSNELNHQIAELKDETTELKRDLKMCNNAVRKLEHNLMAKEKTISVLNGKLAKSAESLNDLHMDKQELNDKINKYKNDLSSQTAKLKLLREENENLKQTELKEGNLLGQSQLSTKSEVELMEEQNEKISFDLEKLQEEMKTKLNEYKELYNDKKLIEENLAELTDLCEARNKEINFLKEKLNDIQANELKLTSQLESSIQDCQKLQEESDKKHEECESFSRQLHSLENEVHSLKSELSIKNDRVDTLTSQFDNLNVDVQLYSSNLELKSVECVKLQEEIKNVKDLLEDITCRLHSKCEECRELTEKVENVSNDISNINVSANNEYEAQLLKATGELVLVKEELGNTTEEWKRLDTELYAKDEEIKNLEKQKSNLQNEKDLLVSGFNSLKKALDDNESSLKESYKSLLAIINDENISQKKKVSMITKEMPNLEQAMEDQKELYKKYTEELKPALKKDVSSQEAQFSDFLENSHQKALQISEQETKLTNMFCQLEEYRMGLTDIQERFQNLQAEYDAANIDVIRKKEVIKKLSLENANLSDCIKQFELSEQELNETREKLRTLEAERVVLECEIQNQNTEKMQILEDSKNEKDKLNLQIKELQYELNKFRESKVLQQGKSDLLVNERDSLIEKVKILEVEVDSFKQMVADHEAGISELNLKRAETLQDLHEKGEKIKTQDDLIEVLKQTCLQKDEEISLLQLKISHAKSLIGEENSKQVKDSMLTPNYDLPALEYKREAKKDVEKDVIVHETLTKCESIKSLDTLPSNMVVNDEHAKHEHDVLLEIEKLQEQLSEKDGVINELQKNNISLLKMLDSKSKSQGDNSFIEIHKLENELKVLKTEREQMMDVLNEKSRDCSSSKAEVQRLMTIVSAQKAALEKLQRDNQELVSKSQDTDSVHMDEMQRETVKNLSRIIRDKDLEIESLTQKNHTLLSVLQESSNEVSELTSLMQDKDNLSKQLVQLQSEREQMITYLNQKHQESVAYHAEVQRLTAFINAENEKNEKMKSDYERLVPQFEDNKQSLIKTHNELINYKQKYQEIEVKYGHMIQQTESGETTDKALYDAKCEESNRLQERYKELMETVKEKDAKVQTLHLQIRDLEQTYRTCDSERVNYKKQVDGFTFQMHGLQTEQGDLKTEIAKLRQNGDSVAEEHYMLKELNNKLTLQVQDKGFEIQSLQEKMNSLTSIIQEQQGEKGQLEHVIHENEATQRRIKQLTMERDQALFGLQQQQEHNNKILEDVRIYFKLNQFWANFYLGYLKV